MARRFYPPKLKDTLRANDRAQRHLAIMAGMDAPPAELMNNVPAAKPRSPIPRQGVSTQQTRIRPTALDIDAVHRNQPVPLEKEILKACLQALRLHPSVAFVGRFNRGVMQSEYNGVRGWTQFNTVPGFPDIHGMLRGGAAFYIECKRPGGVTSEKQSNFLATIKACGGIAGVATSVDEALAIITTRPPSPV